MSGIESLTQVGVRDVLGRAGLQPAARIDAPVTGARFEAAFAEAAGGGAGGGGDDDPLRAAAKAFESAFLAEMLKQARVGEAQGPFNGGYGADAYRSFLVDAYAEAATEQQSLGLAEAIYAQFAAQVEEGGGRDDA